MANEVKKFLDLTGLQEFKTKQDAVNAATYIPLSQRGTANGVATLDNNGLVPAAQLPSYVDDVLSYAQTSAFPAEGETGKIYLAENTGKIYRWAPAADPGEDDPKGSYLNISSAVSTADEAVKLATAHTINGVAFDGTADITINAVDATARIAATEKGAANGVATLDANTLVPAAQLPLATTTTAGAVIVGTNLDVSSGTISVATGTSSAKGVLQVGTNLSVSDGVVSVATATDSALGVAQAGTNIDVSSGVFSVKTGSANDKGVLQVGTNLSVANGVVSVATGTASAKGVLQVGSNISVADGVISVSKTNIEDALGFSIVALTTAEVDTLFPAS